MDRKRERGDNWSQEEKDLFLQIMTESAAIIENKKTDTNTNKRKNLEWMNVHRKFCELSGKTREVEQLKGAWRRIRMSAKKRVGAHKRALNATGGGQKPPSPTDEDRKIMDICPTDFIIENNIFDSDGIFNENVTEEKQNKEVISEICDDENLLEQINESHLAEVEEVIVADIHDMVTNNSTPFTLRSNNDTTIIETLQPKQLFPRDKENIPIKKKEKDTKQKAEEKKRKFELSQKASILQSNKDVKERTMALLEEEYGLKIKYQKQELCHQELRHKLEIDLLMMEKEKRALEIKLLKDKMC